MFFLPFADFSFKMEFSSNKCASWDKVNHVCCKKCENHYCLINNAVYFEIFNSVLSKLLWNTNKKIKEEF